MMGPTILFETRLKVACGAFSERAWDGPRTPAKSVVVAREKHAGWGEGLDD
jgi:hypothetical protein